MSTQLQLIDPNWTPPGWLVDDDSDPWSFDFVIDTVRKAVADDYIDKNGKVVEVSETPLPGSTDEQVKAHARRYRRHRKLLRPGSEHTEIEALAHNLALIRNCWVTDAGVWQLVELLAGEKIVTDPFWNIWSRLNPVVRLDGNDGTDGYDLSQWRGFAGVNGKHSETGKWMQLCAEHGKTNKCAAVAPYRGDKWLWDHGMHADLLLHFGRLHFHPPMSLTASSPTGCTIVPLWLPKDKRKGIHKIARAALAGQTVRVPVGLLRWTGKPYTRDVLITTGCSAKVKDVFKLLGSESL